MADHFIPLAAVVDNQWHLQVTPGLAVGRSDHRFLFGGAGLAAAVRAMELASGRPAIWATAQYLSYARPGTTVTIDTALSSVGNSITQARATISGDAGVVLTASAALGTRPGDNDQWVAPCAVPAWRDCDEVKHWNDDGNLGSRFRFRPAKGFFGDRPVNQPRSVDGRLSFWMRPVEAMEIDRAMLAVMADFMSPGIRNATGRRAGGNSLDNTIRYAALVPTQWVLCDIQIEAMTDGIVHGTMRIHAENGALLASASQSMIVRMRV